MTHTPAPWLIATEPTGLRARHIIGDGYTTVCSFLTKAKNSSEPEEINANAALIAAAPELLKALSAMVKMVCKTSMVDLPEVAQAVEAINKARGAV